MALPIRVQKGADPLNWPSANLTACSAGSSAIAYWTTAALTSLRTAWTFREDGDHIYVEAELPGYRKDEIDINLENQTLTISAEHKESKENKPSDKGEWLLRERRDSRFLRSFTLPATVDPQSVLAKLNDGVLTVTLDKREEAKPRRITVA